VEEEEEQEKQEEEPRGLRKGGETEVDGNTEKTAVGKAGEMRLRGWGRLWGRG